VLTRRALLGTVIAATALGATGCTRGGDGASDDVGIGFTVVARVGEEDAYSRDLRELQETGARWVRVGIQAWDLGGWFGERWYWNEDSIRFFSGCISQARSAGLKVSLTLAAMADADEWTLDQYLVVNRLYWSRCAHLAADAGGVDLVQVYNEHDTRDFRSQRPLPEGPSSPYLHDLAAALSSARAEFRSVLPQVPTTTSVGSPVLDETAARRWMEFFDVVAPAVDVLGLNCYPGDSVDRINELPNRLAGFRERYSKPIAITEIGIPTEAGGVVSPETAQRVLPMMLRRAVEAKPLAVLVYQLRNTGVDARDPEQNFGILAADGARRATYDAVAGAVRRYQR
jgi:hypothetical protein